MNSVKSSTIYCLIQVKFSVRDVHIMLLSICKFCERHYREAQSFHIGVNDKHKWNYIYACTMKPHDLLK